MLLSAAIQLFIRAIRVEKDRLMSRLRDGTRISREIRPLAALQALWGDM